ncbi:MAG: hypothetical protein ACYS17_08910 [Planctomycetota bacterium]|jgi:hypothetical protein
MKNYQFNETALYVSLLITSILLAGCVISDSDMHYSGVESSQLRQIKKGVTTKDQLIGMVGEPSEESTTEDGAEILKYKCTTTRDNQFVMFPPPIVIDDTKEIEHTIVFKIRDGIVQRHWKEK